MSESIGGRRYIKRIEDLLTSWGPSHGPIGRPEGIVIEAGNSICGGSGMAEMMGSLWFRLSVGVRFLAQEGFAIDDQIEVSLGVSRGFPDPRKFAPSVAHSIADLALVVATLKSRGDGLIPCVHRAYLRAAIGTIGETCWEYGNPTQRGRDVDATYQTQFLATLRLKAG